MGNALTFCPAKPCQLVMVVWTGVGNEQTSFPTKTF